MNFYLKYIKYVSTKPVLLGLMILAVITAGLPVLKIRVGNSPEDWNPKGSEKLSDKKEFIKHFGNDEMMVLYLTFPDSSSDNYRLNILQRINNNIEGIKGFEQVFSRYNLSSVEEIMGEAYKNKLQKAYFNSLNPNGEIIFFKVRKNNNPDINRPFLLDSLKRITAKIPSPVKIDLTGPGVIYTEVDRLSTQDAAWLLCVCFGLVFLLLWWRIKKVSYLLLCTFLVLLSMWLAMSLYGWLDIPINTITMIVPLLFIVNFFSFALHLITKHTLDLDAYLKKKIPPITTSALTNIIGFGSLMLSNIHVIYQFGVLTSFGIIAGLLVLFLIGTPLVVRFIGINERIEKQDWMNKLLDAYYNKLSKRVSWFVVAIMVALIFVGIVIFPRVSVDTNSIGFMKPTNKVRQAEEYIDKNYGSVNIVDFLADKKDNQAFSKEDLEKLSEVRQHLIALPFIKSALGYDIWRPLIDRLQALDSIKSVQLSEGFLTQDKLHARLTIQMPSGTVNEMKAMLEKTEKEINKTTNGSSLSIKAVGYLPLYIEQMNTIVNGMLENLSVALLLILLVMSIFVRNLKIGMITTVITVFPLCAIAILMKLFSINFDIATSVISSVLVGMIADDALHIIWSFRKRIRTQSEEPANIIFADSVRNIVYPCTATSIMFALGFAVLMFSNIGSIVNFGILSTSVIIFAWASDFLFFPAILKIVYPERRNH